MQGSSDQISKKVHGQTEICNEICVPILSSQEPRRKNCANTRHCMLSQAAQVRFACERVAMLNALAQSRSAPEKGANEKGRGRGKGKGKGKGHGRGPAGMSTASLDRRLGTLEDRSTFVAILYEEQWKKDLSELRNVWRTQEARRREEGKVLLDAWQAAGSQGQRPDLPAHPLASSLRSVMLKLLMEHVDRKMPQDHPQKANTTKLAKLELQEYDRCIFRAQPRHRECANGKPWMWAIMYQECMTREMRAEFENLFKLHLKEVRFAAQHTQDGPLVKWIMQWKQQQYQQNERSQVPGEDEIMPIDWDGNEGVGGAKRGRSQ